MALVVFLRGVNVGGHKTFQPSVLAQELSEFDVVNVGAAGTFVVRKPVSQAKLRAELLKKLAFQPVLMICPARELLELARAQPFREFASAKDVKQYVSVLVRAPRGPDPASPTGRAESARSRPRLPLMQPAGASWQVKIIAVRGRFVLSLHRRLGRTLVYPNAVVEKSFGVPATTRNWNTIAAICAILNSK